MQVYQVQNREARFSQAHSRHSQISSAISSHPDVRVVVGSNADIQVKQPHIAELVYRAVEDFVKAGITGAKSPYAHFLVISRKTDALAFGSSTDARGSMDSSSLRVAQRGVLRRMRAGADHLLSVVTALDRDVRATTIEVKVPGDPVSITTTVIFLPPTSYAKFAVDDDVVNVLDELDFLTNVAKVL